MKIDKIYHRKVVTARKDDSLVEAARRMRQQHVGDVIVIEQNSHGCVPIGVLTDRDIVVGAIANDLEHLSTLLVGDVMTTWVVTANEEDELTDVIALMRRRGLRRIPVVDADGTLQGIIALDDIMEYLASQLGFLAQISNRQMQVERQSRPAVCTPLRMAVTRIELEASEEVRTDCAIF